MIPSIEQLRVLVAIAESNSLRDAASKLHKTQPALSHSIKLLEDLLDVPLFNRTKYRLELTNQGRIIYQLALKNLASIDEIQQVAKHFSEGNEERVTLALEASFNISMLLPALQLTQAEFPDTQIIIQQEYVLGAVDLLKGKQADLIISPIETNMLTAPEFIKESLPESSLVNVASPTLLAKYPNLSHVEDLIGEYQIVVKGTGSSHKGQDFGVQLAQRRWYVNSFESKLTLIESGMGWGRLPNYMVSKKLREGSLVKLQLENTPAEQRVPYYLVKLKTRIHGPVARTLWANLLDINTQVV